MTTELQTITQAKIEQMTDVKELAYFVKMGELASEVYKAQDDWIASQHAKEISMRSGYRAGQVLLDVPREDGGRPKNSPAGGRVFTPYQKVLKVLEDGGTSKHTAETWQEMARTPKDFFEKYLANLKFANTEFSVYRYLDLAKPLFREEKRAKQVAAAAIYEAREYNGFVVNDVYLADITTIDFPESVVDMIFTDPPYHDEYLDLYQALAKFAKHSLKPGGYCMVYCGKKYLPLIMNMLGECLEYVWEFCVFQPDNSQKFREHHIFEAWRPIVCFKKAGKTNQVAWQPDAIRGTRDKSFHDWQQQIEPALKWIEAYTNPNDLVVDPFVGGGTTVKACQLLKRNYIGFDKDADAVKLTKMRLDHG